MKNFTVCLLAALVLACGFFAGTAMAQDTKAPPAKAEKPGVASESGFDILRGRWVRPDGGYVITIRGVEPDGKLDAAYANPQPLPVAEARASRDNKAIKLFFELRAGGYNGSTYTLTYDPANDVLYGVYYQAVARQKFNVYFERAK
ncbi:MAG: hypothetical protein WAM61_10610 [Desulfobacterales bacterium]